MERQDPDRVTEAEANRAWCPHCHALPGQACMSPMGYLRGHPHAARLREARAARDKDRRERSDE
jgi:hypothetical protein